jgi:hypothetical protein
MISPYIQSIFCVRQSTRYFMNRLPPNKYLPGSSTSAYDLNATSHRPGKMCLLNRDISFSEFKTHNISRDGIQVEFFKLI